MRNLVLVMAALPLAISTQMARAATSESLWQPSSQANLVRAAEGAQPGQARTVELDTKALHQFLDQAARRGEALSLPRPQGGFDAFVLRDSGTLPAELAAKYPQIRSYVGTTADGREARIDVSPLGLQAMVFDAGGVWLVQPKTLGSGSTYKSFARRDSAAPAQGFKCGVHAGPQSAQLRATPGDNLLGRGAVAATTTGATKLNYRIAVATTYEYSRAVSAGGQANKVDALASVTAAINRVNQVYEKEFSIHMTLVANNDRVLYTTANDPYANDNVDVDSNTRNLDRQIGSANYDIGHVFTTLSGQAGLGVVCNRAEKGAGTTGSDNPVGDAFWIDYVAHEIGHQFGANHTFNGDDVACNVDNREPGTAYEPGSGTTIMSYAGICGISDVQPHSDPYFHARSLADISSSLANGGSNCATVSATPSAAPAMAALASYVIPARTPFTLTGAAVSNSGGTLSYDWEQMDLGAPSNVLNRDTGSGPLIRSINPSNSGIRTIPRLSDLLAGTTTLGENLPTTNRTLHFRLTARDTNNGYGSSNSADMTVQSVDKGVAFAVTTPNTAVNWNGGSSQTIQWNVAGTTAAPIACNKVGLDLSTDGGLTFSRNLGTFDNTGSATVVVPNIATTRARIRASCVGNIFFNISAPNFTITAVNGNVAPLASFAAVSNGLVATFTDTSTDSDGTIASRTWSFGDGTSAISQNPSRTYAAAGTYNVSLTVTDNAGASTTTTKSVTVSSPLCLGTTSSGTFTSGSGVPLYERFYQSTVSGTHVACLTGPAGTNFDLYLDKWQNSAWVNVAKSEGATSTERVSYAGAAGYYIWRVVNTSGTGTYTITSQKP